MKVLGIIPARYASSRFPGKPLAMIKGKSMIRRVYEAASEVDLLDTVIVATDDERIYEHVNSFGGKVMMTSTEHGSGTDRCLEVLHKLIEKPSEAYDFILNIQGDEPFIQQEQIISVIRLLEEGADIATLIKKITHAEDLNNPNVVKVVVDNKLEALYFSRASIPFIRNPKAEDNLSGHIFYKHIGLYGFRADILLKTGKLKSSALERAELLEQLRWMENGYRIRTALTDRENIAIDTPEDLLKITNTA